MNPPHPRIWNVPHNRNPLFVGRTDELDELRRTFGIGELASMQEQARGMGGPLGAMPTGRRDIVALTQALAGLGGIGKTSLATEYCYTFQGEYDVVWWLRSEESATLAGDYAALAAKLDPRLASEPNQPALIEFVKDWLRQNERWLLIFDNANAPDEIDAYLPTGGSGHILITSREPVWDTIGKTVAVPTLPRPESIRYLTDYTDDANQDAADALANELDDFPLALEHARAYIQQSQCALAHYLELFRTRRASLWQDAKRPLNYHSTIETTWDISIRQAAAQSPAASDLLNLCAFFAPDDIPLDVIIEGAEFLPESLGATVTDPVALDKAIAALRHFSLIERKNENLFLHRLVQSVTRHHLTEAESKQWAGAAVQVVNDAYPSNIATNVAGWVACARLLQHGLTSAEHAESQAISLDETSRLLNQMASYLRGRAQFRDAQALLERALAIDERQYGADHPKMAIRVNNLGSVLKDMGDLVGAKAHFERALAIDVTKYGREHPTLARDVNNLGSVLQDMGDLAGAKVNYERALAIDERQYGADHPNVAIDVNNLGGVLRDLGDLAGAKAHLERALAIDERQYGPENPTVAIDVNNLGSVLKDMGDLVGAKAHLERALAIDERQYGRDHPNVAIDVNNLGSVLRSLGDLAGAKAYYERALAIEERQYGADHPNVARDVNNLGGVLQDMGDLAGAKAHFERALAIDEQHYGANHPNVARDINNLGSVLRDLGDLAGAKAHFERALHILKRFLGDDHQNTMIVKRNLELLEAELPADNENG